MTPPVPDYLDAADDVVSAALRLLAAERHLDRKPGTYSAADPDAPRPGPPTRRKLSRSGATPGITAVIFHTIMLMYGMEHQIADTVTWITFYLSSSRSSLRPPPTSSA